ncbi:MAG TPA: MFS transporter [Streptosporangiaceae bacterium]|jgi:MFS family permease|nr:MFS transporter [Streptosporangiaceae bacterium]
MTATTFTRVPSRIGNPPRPRLVTPALLLRFATMLGASVSFYLLLSVVPLYAKTAAGGGAAGLATAALMAATVAGELVTPRLAARFGYRLTLAAGLILLGAPALALTGPANLEVVTAVCVVRGLGFAIMVVAGGSLTAALIPAERRGEGLALTGLVAGVPSLAALPAGVWLTRQIGYPPVFIAGAVAALAALAAVPGLPGRDTGGVARRPAASQPQAARPLGVLAALRTPALLRPGLVFAATTTAAGIVVTFLPLTMTRAPGGLVALALFAQAAAATLTRCLAGRHGDRTGHQRMLIPALVAASAGMMILVVTGVPAAVLAGSLLFGAGFGIAQNATLSLMYARMPAASYPAVSAVWNIAYDAGMGLGAAGFGLLAAGTGYPAAFAITAAVMLAALVPALRDRRQATGEPGTRRGAA